MFKCKNCGASIDSIICSYCGTRQEIDLKKRYEIHKETKRVCPNCTVDLETVLVYEDDGLYVERCKYCFGIFLDYGEIEAIMEKEIAKSEFQDLKLLQEWQNNFFVSEKKVIYKKCPECQNMMQRMNYKAQSGVIIDRCNSHGYWLDAGELRAIMEWAKLKGVSDFRPKVDVDISFKSSSSIDKRVKSTAFDVDIVDILVDSLFRKLY